MQNALRLPASPVTDQNQFLASLSCASRARLAPSLERVSLALGEVIYQTGDKERFVYFPNDCLLSVLYVLESGKSTEVLVVGNEGILGTTALLGQGSSWSNAIVQSAGSAYRMPASLLQQELRQYSEIGQLLLIYIQSAMTQTARTSACGRHHTIAEQVCRKLLVCLDRVGGDELTLTQEVIANSLGVRREGVTEVAGMLRDLGVIDYARGRIKVLDRSKLEELACECYSLLTRENHRLMPCKMPAIHLSSMG